jgi:WD40 repeat protein
VQGVYTRYPNRTHVEIWDVPADRPQCSFDCDGVKSAGTFRFSPDGRTVAGKLDAAIVVWNADTGAEQFTLRGHSGRVQEIAFNGNGTRIASVADAGKDKEIRIWDVK